MAHKFKERAGKPTKAPRKWSPTKQESQTIQTGSLNPATERKKKKERKSNARTRQNH